MIKDLYIVKCIKKVSAAVVNGTLNLGLKVFMVKDIIKCVQKFHAAVGIGTLRVRLLYCKTPVDKCVLFCNCDWGFKELKVHVVKDL